MTRGRTTRLALALGVAVLGCLYSSGEAKANPVIQQPPDVTVVASSTCGQSLCGTLTFSLTVTDSGYPMSEVSVSCTIASGSTFAGPVGAMGLDTCQAKDPSGYSQAVQFTVTMAGSVANNSPPTIQGTAAYHDFLSCMSGSWSVYPAPSSFDTAWEESPDGSSWTQVAFGTAPYTSNSSDVADIVAARPEDVGQYFMCEVTASDGSSSITVDSPVVGPVSGPTGTTTTTTTGTTTTTTTTGSTGTTTTTRSATTSTSAATPSPASTDTGATSPASTTSPTPTNKPPTASLSSPTRSSQTSSSTSKTTTSTLTVASAAVITTSSRTRVLTFFVHLFVAGSLSITLVGPTNKALLHFSARAPKGRTTFKKSLPSLRLKPQSHGTLEIKLKAAGKSYDVTTRLEI